MSDKSSANTQNKTKSAKNKVSKLGHDPLSWINDPEIEIENTSNSDEASSLQDRLDTNQPNSDEVAAVSEMLEDNTMLDLPSYFGIAQVSTVYEEMQLILALKIDEIEINAADIESIDTAAIQLLIVFVDQATKSGKSIKWLVTTDKFKVAVTTLNLNNALNLAV